MHVVEIDEEVMPHSPNDDHDFDLERGLVELGGEPSDCLAWAMEHGDVVTSALESMLWELFDLVFGSDQAQIAYGDEDKSGTTLPLSAYDVDLSVDDATMETIGINDSEQQTIRDEAQELGIEFCQYCSGISIAGQLSLNWFPGMKDVLPGDAVVLAEGTGHHHAHVIVGSDSWVEHGIIDDSDDYDPDAATAVVEFYYNWAVYTTKEAVREARIQNLEDVIGDQFERIDGWLREADGLAEEGKCESAFVALAAEVYPAYAVIEERLRNMDAEEDILSWPYRDVEYHHKILNLDLAQLAEIEHKCGVRRPAMQRRSTNAVLEFFQKVHSEAKRRDAEEERRAASGEGDEE